MSALEEKGTRTAAGITGTVYGPPVADFPFRDDEEEERPTRREQYRRRALHAEAKLTTIAALCDESRSIVHTSAVRAVLEGKR